MVIMGFTPDAVGKRLASATKSRFTACVSPTAFTTDVARRLPRRQVPIWWKVKYSVWLAP